ncbi:hypothetical protein RvY_19620, partial [Ramazzottius varieornatus]
MCRLVRVAGSRNWN